LFLSKLQMRSAFGRRASYEKHLHSLNMAQHSAHFLTLSEASAMKVELGRSTCVGVASMSWMNGRQTMLAPGARAFMSQKVKPATGRDMLT
jgi:hypothetical protein